MDYEQTPQKTRWLDLSEHGLELKIAKYGDRSMIVLEGDDVDPAIARRLGFLRAGGEWMSSDRTVLPKKFAAVLEHTKVVTLMSDEIIDERSGDVPKFEDVAEALHLADALAPAAGSTRWLDLSAIGMELKVLCADGVPQVLALEGGEKNPDIAAKLGFAEDEAGRWINPMLADFYPQLDRHHIAGVKAVRVPAEGIFEELQHVARNAEAPRM